MYRWREVTNIYTYRTELNCILLLVMQSRIPYRNSKLTRILQDALGGNSVGLLICNIAPPPKYRQDTLNTLKCVLVPFRDVTCVIVDVGGLVLMIGHVASRRGRRILKINLS